MNPDFVRAVVGSFDIIFNPGIDKTGIYGSGNTEDLFLPIRPTEYTHWKWEDRREYMADIVIALSHKEKGDWFLKTITVDGWELRNNYRGLVMKGEILSRNRFRVKELDLKGGKSHNGLVDILIPLLKKAKGSIDLKLVDEKGGVYHYIYKEGKCFKDGEVIKL